ncbi:hypothetical protein [Hyphomicrobium sp.]|uniref:hypothetical protein n=1 Tax=Hyphomicrobium sp. TaxID=82 RepID=UPI0025BD0985|nr:hypothetical protein [Hyphomicrobium sp.]MCC7251467.1 hypothetical protein [Hyphomicrobium sp.]
MTALPVAYYLKELSGEPSRRGGRGLGAFGSEGTSDLDVQLDEAHARGVLEGRAAAQVENEAAAAAQAAAFEQRLAAERQKWVAEQSTRLGEMIATAFEDLENRVSDVVGEVLKTVLSAEVRHRAVEELAQSLNGLMSKGDYARITISGPPDLLAAMEEQLAGRHAGLSFVAADGADLVIRADETILATRIGAWAEVIAGSRS